MCAHNVLHPKIIACTVLEADLVSLTLNVSKDFFPFCCM